MTPKHLAKVLVNSNFEVKPRKNVTNSDKSRVKTTMISIKLVYQFAKRSNSTGLPSDRDFLSIDIPNPTSNPKS